MIITKDRTLQRMQNGRYNKVYEEDSDMYGVYIMYKYTKQKIAYINDLQHNYMSFCHLQAIKRLRKILDNLTFDYEYAKKISTAIYTNFLNKLFDKNQIPYYSLDYTTITDRVIKKNAKDDTLMTLYNTVYRKYTILENSIKFFDDKIMNIIMNNCFLDFEYNQYFNDNYDDFFIKEYERLQDTRALMLKDIYRIREAIKENENARQSENL